MKIEKLRIEKEIGRKMSYEEGKGREERMKYGEKGAMKDKEMRKKKETRRKY